MVYFSCVIKYRKHTLSIIFIINETEQPYYFSIALKWKNEPDFSVVLIKFQLD